MFWDCHSERSEGLEVKSCALARQPGWLPANHYFLPKNFPIPTLNCTVLIPEFGVANPAFEICM
jgi:hypothetical protein